MKTIYLLIALLLSSFSFAQNRKSLVKEINAYKYNIYESETLPTTKNELIILIQHYFSDNKYRFAYEKNDTLTFVKSVPVTYKNQSYEREIYNYKAGRYEERTAKFYVEVQLRSSNTKQKIPNIYAQLEHPNNLDFNVTQMGESRFNNLDFYRYLHLNIFGSKLKLSPELYTKIENYNSQQTKEKNKLIAGKDF